MTAQRTHAAPLVVGQLVKIIGRDERFDFRGRTGVVTRLGVTRIAYVWMTTTQEEHWFALSDLAPVERAE